MKHERYIADEDDTKLFVVFYQLPGAKYEHWALQVGDYRGEGTIIEFIDKKRSMTEGRPESNNTFVDKLFIAYVNDEKADSLDDAVTVAEVDESAEWASQESVLDILRSMGDEYFFLNQEERYGRASEELYKRFKKITTPAPTPPLTENQKHMRIGWQWDE
ncbi:hypothetical protein BJY00DRAFT_313930 [Aspergillus carlsbadensis]|nr:hypothetical protein BJY00DRAFT_313930 [Aspergillus carlsbadensis]